MNSVQKFCFLWPIMIFATIVSMEYKAHILFESTQIKAIEKRRHVIKNQLQSIPAVQQAQRKNYCYYGYLVTLACAGALTFAQNMSIDPSRINLFESGIGGITLLLSTGIIDALQRKFSDNREALVDYTIIKNSMSCCSKKEIEPNLDEKELKNLTSIQAKVDLDTIYANYDRFHTNYSLPHTRLANWILKKFDLGRTKKHTLLQRQYIADEKFPLYGEKVAQYFGKNSLSEL